MGVTAAVVLLLSACGAVKGDSFGTEVAEYMQTTEESSACGFSIEEAESTYTAVPETDTPADVIASDREESETEEVKDIIAVSPLPENTSEPKQTLKPVPSDSPKVTDTPISTARPTDNPKPDVSPSPERTSTPESTPAPTKTPAAIQPPTEHSHTFEKLFWYGEPTCATTKNYYTVQCVECGAFGGDGTETVPHTAKTDTRESKESCIVYRITESECTVCGEHLGRMAEVLREEHRWTSGQGDPVWNEEKQEFDVPVVEYCMDCYKEK